MRNLLKLHLQFFAADGGTAGGGADSGSTGTDKGDSGTDAGTTGGEDTSWIDSLYADDSTKDDQTAADQPTTKTDDSTEDDTMIPKKRFDSVNSKYKDLSTSNKTLVADMEQLQNDYSALEAAHTAADTRVKSLEKVLTGMVEAELEAIDESYHDLIPSDKSVEEKLDWIRKAKAKGMFGSGSGSYEYEIGGMSNPGSSGSRGRQTQGLNPLQLMQMGYGGK